MNSIEDISEKLTKLEICKDMPYLMSLEPLGITVSSVAKFYGESESRVRVLINQMIDGSIMQKVIVSSETYYWPKELMNLYQNKLKIDKHLMGSLISLKETISQYRSEYVDCFQIFDNTTETTQGKVLEKMKKLKALGLVSSSSSNGEKEDLFKISTLGYRYYKFSDNYPCIFEKLGIEYKEQ